MNWFLTNWDHYHLRFIICIHSLYRHFLCNPRHDSLITFNQLIFVQRFVVHFYLRWLISFISKSSLFKSRESLWLIYVDQFKMSFRRLRTCFVFMIYCVCHSSLSDYSLWFWVLDFRKAKNSKRGDLKVFMLCHSVLIVAENQIKPQNHVSLS